MTPAKPEHAAPLTADLIRGQLVDRIWLGWLLVALIGWPTSLLRILSAGWHPVFATHTALAVAMVGLYLYRRRLPVGFRVAVATLMPFLIGVPALLSFGFYSAGLLWLVMGCLVAALFLDRRVVVGLLIAEAVFLALVAWGFTEGHLTPVIDGRTYIQRADAWLGLLVGTLAASITVVLAIQQHNRALSELLDTVTSQRDLIYHQAMHDPLTGLASRRLARDRIYRACARATRQHGRVALLFIDLNGFKAINDQHGHEAGDALLQAVGKRLTSTIREIDTAARLGGDEFLVLCVDPGETDDIGALADRLLAALIEPVEHGNRSLRVGASIGIALFPDHAASAEQLLACADHAMYRAKRLPDGGWQLYQPEQQDGPRPVSTDTPA